jgi:alpha-glucosidase
VRFALYLRPDEMHGAFNFEFLCSAWEEQRLRDVINATLTAHQAVGAAASWVLNNHDVTRIVSRFGRSETGFNVADRRHNTPVDLALGTRRARAAMMLALALPGAVYLYQGEELGLWEVEDIPYPLRTDPMFHRSGQVDPGRDGCRVPLPWSGDSAPFGFSPPSAKQAPWLPQPAAWKAYTVEAQTGDPASMLEFYRTALTIRAASPSLGDGSLSWLRSEPQVLAFARDDAFACVVNLSDSAIALPEHRELLLASGPIDGGLLAPDTTVWLLRA